MKRCLRQWGLLQGWLAEDAGLLGVLDGVKRASRDWAANAKGAAWLTHTGERLKAAEQLAERPDLAANLEPTDRDYLAACREAERAATVASGACRRPCGVLALLAFSRCRRLVEPGLPAGALALVYHHTPLHADPGSALCADRGGRAGAQAQGHLQGVRQGLS